MKIMKSICLILAAALPASSFSASSITASSSSLNHSNNHQHLHHNKQLPFSSRRSMALSSKFGWRNTSDEIQRNGNPLIGGATASTSNAALAASGNVSGNDAVLSTSSSSSSTLLISAAVVAAVLFFSPLSSHAADITSITSSTSLASAASLLEQLSETGFYQAFSLVFLSEIGDKTFFIAGLLAMKTSRFISYLGSMGALAAMTVLSCLIGQIFHAVPSGIAQGIPLDDVAAVLAFTFFGVKTLMEANELGEGESVMDEELKDAEETVEGSQTIKEITAWGQIASTFALVFAAEFGDRSFLSTIALSAAQNPFSVCAGAVAAHGVATGVAVLGGSYVAKYISEKVIGYIGGSLFLVFALTTALGIF